MRININSGIKVVDYNKDYKETTIYCQTFMLSFCQVDAISVQQFLERENRTYRFYNQNLQIVVKFWRFLL